MVRRNPPKQPSSPPAPIGPFRALELLREQRLQIERLEKLSRRNDELEPWETKTKAVLRMVFGDPSRELNDFERIRFHPGVYYNGQPESDFHEAYIEGLKSARALLDSIIFAYEESHPQASIVEAAPAKETVMGSGISNLYFVAHEFSASALDDLRSAIREALTGAGLDPYFADKEVVEGQIFVNKILPKIKHSRFGIYDISNPEKPNVFLELGAAIAIEARYYIIVRKGVGIPSDLQGLDRIEYQSFTDLKAQLREKIKI